jgi:hypothetical protein
LRPTTGDVSEKRSEMGFGNTYDRRSVGMPA